MIYVIAVLSLAISAFALAIVLKDRSRRPYAADLEEFRLETSRLIAEFNRIAERDTGILDDRLALVQQEIRSARKAEEALKKLIEEARRGDLLAGSSDFSDGDDNGTPHPKEAFGYSKESPPPPEEPLQNALFDGFSVERIKNYAKHRNSPRKKHELLLQHLKENKNRDELLEMGFSPNEINLALLNLSTSQDEE